MTVRRFAAERAGREPRGREMWPAEGVNLLKQLGATASNADGTGVLVEPLDELTGQPVDILDVMPAPITVGDATIYPGIS